MNGPTCERSLREEGHAYLPRDFVETSEGLIFAVVAPGTEDARILGFLRYVRAGSTWRKLDTATANQLLQTHFTDYLYYSRQRDVAVHGVHLKRVVRHYRPSTRLAEIMVKSCPDALEEKVRQLARMIAEGAGLPAWLGVTGSLLVESHQAASDIDLVCYGRDHFAAARQTLRSAQASGALDALSDTMWRDAYARRGCSLSFDDYLWHELRKHNKFACGDTKVDISCIVAEPAWMAARSTKLGRAVIRAPVTDDTFAFDYPAHYPVQHPSVRAIVCFTPTYAGQALAGETVEAAGWIEQAGDGTQHLTVGTSREAAGQYVKVVREPNSRA